MWFVDALVSGFQHPTAPGRLRLFRIPYQRGTSCNQAPGGPHQTDGAVAYGFWLHRMTGSAMEANHFARDYGITHHPTPSRTSPDLARQTSPCEQPRAASSPGPASASAALRTAPERLVQGHVAGTPASSRIARGSRCAITTRSSVLRRPMNAGGFLQMSLNPGSNPRRRRCRMARGSGTRGTSPVASLPGSPTCLRAPTVEAQTGARAAASSGPSADSAWAEVMT
ncbi:DUF6417 family protein [Streptomyces scabiei]|uniref:DUF6417 family protein n=1 Tax=Streptomyces scabiei TaxID=1930 RepID=UPI00131B6CAB|nr:DUF6417 family protein [Streptomyces scabiei]